MSNIYTRVSKLGIMEIKILSENISSLVYSTTVYKLSFPTHLLLAYKHAWNQKMLLDCL